MFHLDLGDGLELALLREHHAEEVFRLMDLNRERLRQWLPWVDRTHSAEQPREFIVSCLGQYERREALNAGIFQEGQFIGSIGVHKIDTLNRNTSMGYWLDAAHEGTGMMTRACRAMVTYAFTEYQLHRMEIRCGTGNTKSCAIPRRLGFEREGVVREAQWVGGRFLDLVIWGMLAREWKP